MNKKVNEALLKLGSFEKKYKTNRTRNRNDKIIDMQLHAEKLRIFEILFN